MARARHDYVFGWPVYFILGIEGLSALLACIFISVTTLSTQVAELAFIFLNVFGVISGIYGWCLMVVSNRRNILLSLGIIFAASLLMTMFTGISPLFSPFLFLLVILIYNGAVIGNIGMVLFAIGLASAKQ